MDWDRELNYAREYGYDAGYGTGYDSGVNTGRQGKAVETAENLLKSGLGTVQQISGVTGLSVSEVEKIKERLVCVK